MWCRVFALSSAFAIVTAAACGGQISGADGGASCTVPAGTYTEHFTAQASGCAPINDVTYTFNATTTFAVGDAGPTSPGPGCTASVDGASCTVSYACTTTSNGYTIQTNMTLVYKSDGTATGTVTENLTGNNANQTCTYSVSVTKQ